MKAQEAELALEEVEKAGEEQAKFGQCLTMFSIVWKYSTYSLNSVKLNLMCKVLFISRDISKSPVWVY